ncbi:hypothetical protein NMY22_g16946 [Coprinellus aureogranulatus]|nr:hypothetical protein NMY22_g16946 [Coprinellus aureogranulatus]
MRFQLTALISAALFIVSAQGQSASCPEGETAMCCYNIDPQFGVGYYCGTPNQTFPCQIQDSLAMCCKSYSLTPRGTDLISNATTTLTVASPDWPYVAVTVLLFPLNAPTGVTPLNKSNSF